MGLAEPGTSAASGSTASPNGAERCLEKAGLAANLSIQHQVLGSTIVLGARRSTDGEVNRVKRCLTG